MPALRARCPCPEWIRRPRLRSAARERARPRGTDRSTPRRCDAQDRTRCGRRPCRPPSPSRSRASNRRAARLGAKTNRPPGPRGLRTHTRAGPFRAANSCPISRRSAGEGAKTPAIRRDSHRVRTRRVGRHRGPRCSLDPDRRRRRRAAEAARRCVGASRTARRVTGEAEAVWRASAEHDCAGPPARRRRSEFVDGLLERETHGRPRALSTSRVILSGPLRPRTLRDPWPASASNSMPRTTSSW